MRKINELSKLIAFAVTHISLCCMMHKIIFFKKFKWKKPFSVYQYRYNVMHTKSWILLSNYSNFASGKICNESYLFQKCICWWFSSKHFFLDTCHMIAFYSIIWMYSWRIHLVLFIVHPKQHKGFHSLSLSP